MVLTATGFGVSAAQRLCKRTQTLELLSRLAKQLAENVRYTAAPLSALVAKAAQEQAFAPLRFLTECVGEDPRTSICRAAREEAAVLGLDEEDSRLLAEFFSGFGQADAIGESERCRRFATLFEKCGEEARAAYKHKSTLYVTLGVCGGSMAALLLGG